MPIAPSLLRSLLGHSEREVPQALLNPSLSPSGVEQDILSWVLQKSEQQRWTLKMLASERLRLPWGQLQLWSRA